MELTQGSRLLQCPSEIRLRIYDMLFDAAVVVVEPAPSSLVAEGASPAMLASPMGSQCLRTCRQMYVEGRAQLYSKVVFDCSQREAMKLLLQNIGPQNFSIITHVITDWDELQTLSWALAKDEYQAATAGLHCLELATCRTKVTPQSTYLWKRMRSYERQLCQSAFDICKKHRNLNLVVESKCQRSQRTQIRANDVRIKWRFVPSEQEIIAGESIISIVSELEKLNSDQQDDQDRELNLVIDAF